MDEPTSCSPRVVNPAGLSSTLEDQVFATMPEFGDYRRMVRRNDGAVATGRWRRCWWAGALPCATASVADVGRVRFGLFLGADEPGAATATGRGVLAA